MTDKKYITGAEVLRALADGKKVRFHCWRRGQFLAVNDGRVSREDGNVIHADFSGKWEVVEEPATDAEVIAEFLKRSKDPLLPSSYQMAMRDAAYILEKRKVEL